MRKRTRLGAVLVAAGSVLMAVGTFGSPASAAPSEPIDVCATATPTPGCEGAAEHGSVTWSIASGGIVLTAQAAAGTEWRAVSVCLPGAGPTKEADCDATAAGVLDAVDGDYVVSGPSAISTTATETTFDCASTLTVTIPRSTLNGLSNPIPWAIGLEACGGETGEAFGTSSRGSPSGALYQCEPATNVTTTSATLAASTTDQSVTRAAFVFTEGLDATFEDTNAADGLSVIATGLKANSAYRYNVRFFNAEGDRQFSRSGCIFATPKVSSQREVTTTTTTSTTTTSTTTTTLQEEESVVAGVSTDRPRGQVAPVDAQRPAAAQLSRTGTGLSLAVVGALLIAAGLLLVVSSQRLVAARRPTT